ncbi:MAG TPA: TonB-dependent receptor [Puia sp.]
MRQSAQRLKAIRLLSRVSFVLFLAVSTLQSMAQAPDPLKTTISIDADKQPLEKVLKDIASGTKIKFAYDVEEIKKYTITLREKKQFTLEDLLKKVLQQTDLVYESHAHTIVIFNKEDAKPLSQDSNDHSFSFVAYKAPQEIITGTVVDEDGPLQNVNVTIKGTTMGTQTDEKGGFKLESDGKEVAVVVSFVGYQARQVTVKAGAANIIRLEKAETELNKVVVVGYGTQKRTAVTGAVADVKLDKLSSRSLNNVAEALQAKAPGVYVENQGGDPTSPPNVYIRGLGGINGESVLYVVDGSLVNGTPVINPNEIESISVLKDASAAIYGARASGGVILITTKKGKSGAALVTLDAKFGAQKAWRLLQPLNAKEYSDVENLAYTTAGKTVPNAFNASIYPDGQITRTNWMDDIFRTGAIQDYNIGVTGGNEKSKYFMGFGYRNQQGILLNTYSKRYTFRLNADNQVKSWLRIGENLSFSNTNGNGANTTDDYQGALISAIFYPPSVAPYNADGSFAGVPTNVSGYGDVINPVAYLKRLDYSNPVNTLVANPYAEIRLLPGLVFRSNFSYTSMFNYEKDFSTRVPEAGKPFLNNQLNQYVQNYTNILAEQTLTYNKSFGLHTLNVLGGYAYQHNKREYLDVYVTNFDDENPAYRYLQNGAGIYPSTSGKDQSALVSFFSRVNYDYNGKYFVSLLGRRDGSSLVASQNRFENYGSVSGGWMLSREDFMKGIDWLSQLKLRASYGILGNLGSLPVNAVSPLLQQTSIYQGQTPTLLSGYGSVLLPNPDLKWAKSRQTNLGVDLGLFRNRVTLTADYFVKNTERMIMRVVPPITTGESGQWVNGGSARDKGIELGLSYNSNPARAFQYGVTASLTAVNDRLISLRNGDTIESTGSGIRGGLSPVVIKVGQPIYSYYAIRTAGLFQSQAQVNSYTGKTGSLIQPNAKPGDVKFVDANGDGKIDNNDRVSVGSPFPKFSYGFSFNASYKGFDLNIFAQGVYGNKLFHALRYTSINAGSGANYNMLKEVLNAWTPTHTNTYIPRINASDDNGNFGNVSDFYVEDGSYVRIKNATLGYTLPVPLTSKLKVNSIRLYVTANNLLTITKYTGFDPEVGMNQYGMDAGFYPQARSFLAGLSVNF